MEVTLIKNKDEATPLVASGKQTEANNKCHYKYKVQRCGLDIRASLLMSVPSSVFTYIQNFTSCVGPFLEAAALP